MTDYFAVLGSGIPSGALPASRASLPLFTPHPLSPPAHEPLSDEEFHHRLEARASYITLVIVTVFFVGAVFFAWSP